MRRRRYIGHGHQRSLGSRGETGRQALHLRPRTRTRETDGDGDGTFGSGIRRHDWRLKQCCEMLHFVTHEILTYDDDIFTIDVKILNFVKL